MLRKATILLMVTLFFSIQITVFADEKHRELNTSNSENSTNQLHNSTNDNVEHQVDTHHQDIDQHSEKALHETEEEVHTHHDSKRVESPPNLKVLGSFGAINFTFLLIGIWNKWSRRKGK